MKKAAIIWNIIVIILSILFACNVISDMSWLIGVLATTLFCNIVHSEEEKKRKKADYVTPEEMEELEKEEKSREA